MNSKKRDGMWRYNFDDDYQRLPKDFVKAYEAYNMLHDRFLVNLYIGNTGNHIFKYSKRGSHTVQIEFDSGYEGVPNLMLIYTDVVDMKLSYELDDYNPVAFTGFGQCITSKFTMEDEMIRHDIDFDTNSQISIICKKISFRKINV